MKKRSLRIVIVAIIIVLLAGGYVAYRSLGKPDMGKSPGESQAKAAGGKSVPVTVYVAGYATLEEGIRTVGTLLPWEQVELGSEVAGLIERITFDEGSAVRKGSLLVKINDDDLRNQLMRTKFQRDLLKDKLDRNRILLEKDAISRESFDQIQTDYNLIEADIQLLEIKIGKTEITSPLDGVIGFRDVSVGTYVPVGKLIAVIVDGSKLKLEFAIPEKYSSLARVGSEVSFTVEGVNEVKRARIYAVDSRIDPRTRTIAMRARYDNPGLELTPGMFAGVTIGQTQSNTLQVPTQAIVPTMDGSTVWLARGGRAVQVPVNTGVRGDAMIEIAGGIGPGDSVIVSGLLHVREGAQLQVLD